MDDELVKVGPLLGRIPDWPGLLASALSQEDYEAIRRAERIGRPMGSAEFVRALEERVGRALSPQKPGRKRRAEEVG